MAGVYHCGGLQISDWRFQIENSRFQTDARSDLQSEIYNLK